jgi:hypothetical protein
MSKVGRKKIHIQVCGGGEVVPFSFFKTFNGMKIHFHYRSATNQIRR